MCSKQTSLLANRGTRLLPLNVSLARNVREAGKQEFKWVIASPRKLGPFNKEDNKNGYWVTNSVLATRMINFLNQYNLVIGRKKRKMVTMSEKSPWRYPGVDWADRAFECRKMKSFVILGWPVARFSHQLCTLRALDFIYYQQFRSLYPLTLPLFQRKKRPTVYWSHPCSLPCGSNQSHFYCILVVSLCASVSFTSMLYLPTFVPFPW